MVNPNTYIIIYFINHLTTSLVLPVNTNSLSDLNTFDTDLRSKQHHVFPVVFEDMTKPYMTVFEDMTKTHMPVFEDMTKTYMLI